MSYTDLRDFAPEYVEQSELYPHLWVAVEKLGGGTVGKQYDGTWRYIVIDESKRKELMRGQDYIVAYPINHKVACLELLDYAVETLDLI